MTDRLEIQNEQDTELKKQLENIDWNLDYGSVKIQIRNGKPTLITTERTVRWDYSLMSARVVVSRPELRCRKLGT